MNSKHSKKFAMTLALSLGVVAPAFGQASANSGASTDEKVVVMDTFEVTSGFASSLAAATELKQEQKVITEVIAAEDIGKLPDISIADALTRLTGLTTQRTNGRSQQISIRGLNGDFSTGLLNGREQVSTGLNRAVEFDQYPADLLSEVVVYKTASPSLTSQGLAGCIDLRTVRPLERGRVVAVNGYYEWNQLGALTPSAKSTGNRATFSYIDQLADGKVGVAFGYSHSSKPFAGQQFQAWGYPTDDDGNLALGGMKPYVRNSVLDRDGYMGVIEFKPNENIHSVLDIFYSEFEENQLLRGMEVPLAFWSSASLQPGYTVSDGLITDATLTNVQPIVRNDTFVRNDEPIAIGWNLVLGEDSEWPITFDASYSRVKRKDFNLELWSGIGSLGTPFTTADTMTVHLTPGQLPMLTTSKNYADPSILKLGDPQGWQSWKFPTTGAPGYYKGFQSKDELGQFKLSTRHELDGKTFSAFEVGVSYTDRYKRDGENPSGFPVIADGAATAPVPEQVGLTDFSYVGLGEIYAFDPLAYFNSGALTLVPSDGTDFVARRFQVWEKVTQLYSQLEIDTKIGNLPVTGNVGFRVIHTDQSSSGLSANGNAVNAVTAGDTYTEFAPSLNLNFDITADSVIRFSLARQIARPRMYDLRASRTWGYDATKADSDDINNGPWSGGGGNSALRPWIADSIDLSYERYFENSKGYFSVAAFGKKLRNFIYEQSDIADFSGYPIQGATSPILTNGVVTQPVNGDGGNVYGLEMSLVLASELINPDFKGFGMQLGGALTKSSIKPWGPTGDDAPISGLSEKVAQITLYYERYGWSVRASNRYRSENRQYITNFGVPNPSGDVNPNGGFSMAQPESVVDGQISYTFQKDSPVSGLSLFLQGYNLTNEPLLTYNADDPRQVINYQKYGASYSLGFSYKF